MSHFVVVVYFIYNSLLYWLLLVLMWSLLAVLVSEFR